MEMALFLETIANCFCALTVFSCAFLFFKIVSTVWRISQRESEIEDLQEENKKLKDRLLGF